MTPTTLSPVEEIDGMYVKRDDLFMLNPGDVNGGKLRQCWYLIDSVKDTCERIISCCSIHSPQAPITAAVAKQFNKPCTIYYGGTSVERLNQMEMPLLANKHGARFEIYPSGRHNVLYAHANRAAERDKNIFIVDYGFNLDKHPDLIFGAVADQVENIPDTLDTLIITCGSGITATGVIYGLKKFNKQVRRMILVATAPSREKRLRKALQETGLEIELQFIDLFHTKGFVYEKGAYAKLGDVLLHPNYEAKTYLWLKSNPPGGGSFGKMLFWIVGAKPTTTTIGQKIRI